MAHGAEAQKPSRTYLEHSVQQAIEVETAKQASMMAWESQMNARMLKSRQEHER